MIQRIKKIIKSNKVLSVLIIPILENRKRNRQDNYYTTIFSNVIEGNLIVTLENIPGKFQMDARSHILREILLTKEYEPKIVKHIISKIDSSRDAINIGANIGLFTNLLASNINNSCKVLAIEPTPNAYTFLQANIVQNEIDTKVITYNGIASDKTGIYFINIIPGNEEYSSIGEMVHPAIKNREHTRIEVNGETIDNLVEKHNLKPGIIVMDVEGAEFDVLNGAIETLRRHQPIIIAELNDNLLSRQNTNSTSVVKFLENLNYQVFDVENKIPVFPFSGNIIAKINTSKINNYQITELPNTEY